MRRMLWLVLVSALLLLSAVPALGQAGPTPTPARENVALGAGCDHAGIAVPEGEWPFDASWDDAKRDAHFACVSGATRETAGYMRCIGGMVETLWRIESCSFFLFVSGQALTVDCSNFTLVSEEGFMTPDVELTDRRVQDLTQNPEMQEDISAGFILPHSCSEPMRYDASGQGLQVALIAVFFYAGSPEPITVKVDVGESEALTFSLNLVRTGL